MELFITELHYDLREHLYNSAITLCTEELSKGKDPYVSFWRSFAYCKQNNLIEALRDLEYPAENSDYKMSCLYLQLYIYSQYPNPDEGKMEKIRNQIDPDTMNRCDVLTSMRFFTYTKEEEKFMEMYEKLDSLKQVNDGEELIVQGWKFCLDDNPNSWVKSKEIFMSYVQNFGNENLDAILGGLKALERIQGVQKTKNYEEILDTFAEIIKNNSYSKLIIIHIERLKIYLLKNLYEDAHDYITNRLQNTKNFEIFKILSICSLMQDGDFKAAEYNLNKMWELMLSSEPKNPELYYNTCHLFMRLCDKNREILGLCDKFLEKALEYEPKNATYLLDKGYLYVYFYNDLNKGIEIFEKCGELDSQNKENSYGLIWCKILQNKIKEASEDINFLQEIMESVKAPKSYQMALYETITKAKLPNPNETEVLGFAKETLKIYIQYNKAAMPWNKYEMLINANYDFLLDLAEVLLSFYDFNSKIAINSVPDCIRQAQRILQLLSKNRYSLTSKLLSAKIEFLSSELNQAIEILDEIISLDNNNVEALMFKAMIFIEKKDFRKAKEILNDAVISNLQVLKNNSNFLVLKSKAELGLNDVEHSQESLNNAITNFDDTVEEYKNKMKFSLFKLEKKDKLELMKLNINIMIQLGKTEEAQSYMNKLVTEFQDMGDEILMLHSDLAIKTGDLKKGVHLLHKVDDKDEKLFKKSRIKLAEIYLNQIMDRRLYSWCYKEILDKFPNFDNLKLAANAAMFINSPDEAVVYYKEALKIKNDMEVMRDLGRALIKTHDYKEAIDYYMDCSKIDDRMINNQTVVFYYQMMQDYIDLLYLLARNVDKSKSDTRKEKMNTLRIEINSQIKKLLEALKKYNEFHLESILSKFRYTLSKVIKFLLTEFANDKLSAGEEVSKQEILRQLDEAAKLEKKVLVKLKELKQTPEIKESKEFLGLIFFEVGYFYENIEPNIELCEKSYKESVEYDNSNMDSLFGITYLLLRKQRFEEAQSYINMLLHEDESNDEALTLLVSVLNGKKDAESSLEFLENMIQKQPNSYHLIELYINILYRSGNINEAKEILYKSEKMLKFTYTPGLYYCKGLFHRYSGEINKALIEFSKAKTDEVYGIKCLEQILEIYMNPDCDTLLINLDEPWNQNDNSKMSSNNNGLLQYSTDDLNIDAITFLIKELKLRRDDDRTKVYETYASILNKSPQEINSNLNDLKEIFNTQKDNLNVCCCIIMCNLILKNIPEMKKYLSILESTPLNIKYYSDYERGLLLKIYLLMMTDNFAKAEEYAAKVIMLNIALVKGYEFIAMIKERQNKTEEACSYYENAFDYSNKNNANVGYKLVVNYLNSKQNIKALNVCNEIKRKFKDYPIDELMLRAKNSIA